MLFAGRFLPVVIMAGSLEFAKLIIASFLYRYWEDISKLLKSYLLVGLLILMLITSGGIFGFLSDAYNKASGTAKMVDKELVLIQKQKSGKEAEIQRFQDRINQLTNIRQQEETRVDTLYSRKYTSSAKAVLSDIKETTAGIEQYNSKIESLQKDIAALDTTAISKESAVLSSDVGPLRYIATIFDTTMDNVVKWLIFLLIFVFDPVAVTLIVAFNITLFKDGKQFTVPRQNVAKTVAIEKKEEPTIETSTSEQPIQQNMVPRIG